MAGGLDLIGKRYDRLTVVDRLSNDRQNKRTWLCVCDCGSETKARTSHLTSGNVRSCGCKLYDRITHGHYGTPTYVSWYNMKSRCNNPKATRFDDYGGRGISVCERWDKFENFLADMGERPEGMSIDRINVNGNYEPGNCRWATRSEQELNKRRNTVVALNTNLSNVEPSLGASVAIRAEGWHTGMITQTVSKNADKGQSKNAFLECTISYQDGGTFIVRLNLWNDNPDAVRIANQELAALVAACGLNPQLQDSQQLHNIPFEHYLSVEKDTYKDREITVNRLKAVKDRTGKVIGNVPPPKAGATQAGGQPGGFQAPQGGAPQPGGFQAPQGGQPGGFAPPNGGGAPQPGQPQPGGPAQPWGQPGAAPQPGQPQPGQPGGFAPPQGGYPQPNAPQAPQQQGYAPPQQQQAPQQGGYPAPQPGGFAPPQGGPWGGPQG